ncbi:MAG: hypothetical protein Q9167_001099 [Letrouitia subvulpina]
MDVFSETASLLSDQGFARHLPQEAVDALRHGRNEQYLSTLAKWSLDPTYTVQIFVNARSLFVEICGRWLDGLSSQANAASVLAALASVIPFAPHLSIFVNETVKRSHDGPVAALRSSDPTLLADTSQQTLCITLLSILRLLYHDNKTFAFLVKPSQLQVLLRHPHRPIRYLTIKILCLYLHASDATFTQLKDTYLGSEEIDGRWEDKQIDYTFLSLWEEHRLGSIRRYLDGIQSNGITGSNGEVPNRFIGHADFSPTTACIAGVLIPCIHGSQSSQSSIIETHTVSANIRAIAKGLLEDSHLLITGPSGSGKTFLIKEIARQLSHSSSMIVLHLNEQTDTRALIGLYSSSEVSGSFKWRPGVLTKAVMEGCWVIIEDLDRAPPDVMSTLLSLLERKELLVPNLGDTIRAAPGFKLIATVRSLETTKGEKAFLRDGMIGTKHWLHVPLKLPAIEELRDIVSGRFPILNAYMPWIFDLYKILISVNSSTKNTTLGKPHGPRDLIRWCRRISDLLLGAGIQSSNEPVSETLHDGIFLEAVDCFAGGLAFGHARDSTIEIISRCLHIPIEKAQFYLRQREPQYTIHDDRLTIGRSVLFRRKSRPRPKAFGTGLSTFATTGPVLRSLESIGVAVKMVEPVLLIGETGTGKTTLVQHLAHCLNHELVVVNLSQQSEVSDLLGGSKPVNPRSLAVTIKDDFDDLFGRTFPPSKTNQAYIERAGKAVAKRRWSTATKLWEEAVRMANRSLSSKAQNQVGQEQRPSTKRRKLEYSQRQGLRIQWQNFSSRLQTFQRHLESGNKGFAFSFIEGNIVKAARHGNWLLLDEINLASPDTLESLADLIASDHDDGRSLLLSESGKTERIYAHEDFRIFGAMNPATDIGKRDLPISLRSRFTEIVVEAPDKCRSQLVNLVKALLRNYDHLDSTAAVDVSELYLEIQKLANESRLADGANQKPHFSLRTLTRTIKYAIDIAPLYGFRRALYEGFTMSFSTQLNLESESLLMPLIHHYILGKFKNSRALLSQIPKIPEDSKSYVRFHHYLMTQGTFKVESQPHYIITPFVERNLLNLVRATSTRNFPVLLQGPTSSGKTSMVEYLAKLSGNKFVRVNNHEHTDLQEYLGTYQATPDGHIQFQEGVLVQALREGYWIVLDELNLAPTDVLEALNRLLDDKRELLIPETQQIVRPHENFMLFATQNPPGMYGGRKMLSRAFRSRFLELHFDDIPEDELETILRERSQIAPSFCTKIVATYKRLSLVRQTQRLFEQKNSFITLRDLFRWAFRDADDREQLTINGFLILAERVRNPRERIVVKQIIEDVMKVKIEEESLYSFARLQALVAPSDLLAQEMSWTISTRRLFVLVYEALKHNEPVLLIGGTGSGKTSICQVVARLMGKELYIVNAHQNMETGDLIGSQRPFRGRSSIERNLRETLIHLLSSDTDANADNQMSTDLMLQKFDLLMAEKSNTVPIGISESIMGMRSQLKTLFEWIDGALVRAMRAGHYFLLDEISLADDSVLERLNSVLEPGRFLFLAEKATNDALVTASDSFQFLATMNPGGDYGKKELSPALRNRFTEIWAPTLSAEQEVVEIIQRRLQLPKAKVATQMVAFASWFGSTYGQALPLVSVRDLLSWADFIYANVASNESILHGCALVYIDSLGANPTAKISTNAHEVAKQREVCLAKLSQIFSYDMASLYHKDLQVTSDSARLCIGPFSLEKSPGAVTRPDAENSYNLKAPTTLKNALKIMRALQLKKPILIEGNPGVGKTTLVAALADEIGMSIRRINLSDQTDLMDLFGSDIPVEDAGPGHFIWQDAPFLQAMLSGEWVILDEMNLASQSVLEGLNACFDHRGEVYISELDRIFTRHPNFIVFATQNPHHQGGGRKGLPQSFVDRFTVVYADPFSLNDLRLICSHRSSNSSKEEISVLTNSVAKLNDFIENTQVTSIHGGPWAFNLRDLQRWLCLLSSNAGLLPAGYITDFLHILFLQRFRTAKDANTVSSFLRKYFPSFEASHNVFHSVGIRHLQIGLGVLRRLELSQSMCSPHSRLPLAHLSLAESVMLCIQNNWSCLLVGASGSGKTGLINFLANSTGAHLVYLPLNADMDTMDLIGGYEYVDARRRISAFRDRVKNMCQPTIIQQLISPKNQQLLTDIEKIFHQGTDTEFAQIHELLDQLELINPSLSLTALVKEYNNIIAQSQRDNRARFEWVDGIIVKALQEGKWLVLDNANLCNPSVLDRLNSVLEPDGFLTVNEYRSRDGSSLAIKPHPDFRLFLTMDPRHDVSLLRRWYRQILQGLFALNTANMDQFSRVFETYEAICMSTGYINKGLMTAYERYAKNLHVPDGFWEAQTIHPLHNPALVSLGASHNPRVHIKSLGALFELLKNIVTLEQRSALLVRNVEPKLPQHMTKIQRSMATESSERYRMVPTQHIATFTVQFSRSIREFLDKALASFDTYKDDVFSALHFAISWLNDVFDLSMRPDLEEAEFQVYLEIGSSLSTRMGSIACLKDIANSLEHNLAGFDPSWQLSSGQSMQILWFALKPQTSQNLDRLSLKLQVENFAQRFESVCWASGASIDELGRLYQTISNIYIAVSANLEDVRQEYETASDALAALEKLPRRDASWDLPYLREEFEQLLQYRSSIDRRSSVGDIWFLKLLAQRPICSSLGHIGSSVGWRMLANINDYAGIRTSKTALSTIRNTFSIVSLQKLGRFSRVPLHSLDPLVEELKLFAKYTTCTSEAICSDHHYNLLNMIARFHVEILQVHQDFLRDESLQSLKNIQASSSSEMLIKLESSLWELKPDFAGSNFRSVVGEYFRPSLQVLIDASRNGAERLRNLAMSWVLFFTGCLQLYVPDRPFDPALKPVVERERYYKRKLELENELKALRLFENVFTGQNSNLRCRILEEKLQNLGAEPPPSAVVRPQVSELAHLQGEFNNILRSIVGQSPSAVALDQTFKEEYPVTHQFKFLKSNIARAYPRLLGNYRAYDDITKPIIAFLEGLDTGLTMALLALSLGNSNVQGLEHISRFTPFLGLSIEELSRASRFSFKNPCLNTGMNLIVLKSIGLQRNIESELVGSDLDILIESFHKIYEDWKSQLAKDQIRDLNRSSLYTYRGGEAQRDAAADEEFRDLFPDYELSTDDERRESTRSEDPKSLAQALASCQHYVFYQDVDSSRNITELFESTSDEIAKYWEEDSCLATFSLSTKTLLPAVILQLDKQIQKLQSLPQKQENCNFYTHPNLHEAQKLVVLVRQIKIRFENLSEVWPEHATPHDVLRIVTGLLAMPNSAPIAKLLTKAEQLHSFVHEWQVIASREFSAASLYDRLTTILIDWRRLELLTWAQLFDMEEKKCKEDVDSWWFVAYEVIVATPLSIADSSDELQAYAEQCFVALQEFLLTASTGQFSQRLQLLNNFRQYLKLMEQVTPKMAVIRISLSNFLDFFGQFEKTVGKSLQKSRDSLETEMKDVLLLASWKDTNINALRESAKRSHHKLFKIVRKFRALLAQPLDQLLTQEFAHNPDGSTIPESSVQRLSMHHLDDQAARCCSYYLQNWSERPSRLTNIDTTIKNMIQMSQLPSHTDDALTYLCKFADDVVDSMKNLKDETPSTSTTENEDLVQHLKMRKRKLLSDTLKELHQLGFRANISSDLLASQASLSTVLAQAPALTDIEHGQTMSVAEHHLHEILHRMSQVRQSARSHSHDLSQGEVSRCIGYLESILSLLLRQRKLAVDNLINLQNLEKTIELLKNTWNSQSYEICILDSYAERDSKQVKKIVDWLPGIIGTGCVIIEKHGRLGQMDHGNILQALQDRKSRIEVTRTSLRTLPKLPDGLDSSLHLQHRQDLRTQILELKESLKVWKEQYPSLAFVLEQIELWTGYPQTPSNDHTNSETSITLLELDQNVSSLSDKVLVAVQRFANIISAIPPVDRNSWLTNQNNILSDSLRNLHLSKINDTLEEIASSIQRLVIPTSPNLNPGAAVCAMALPIVQQYRDIAHNILDHYVQLYGSLCKTGSMLTRSFTGLASRGFCSPADSSTTRSQSEKTKEGTGLGEGEGAEDVSESIEDDEDISELAQEGQKEREGEQIERHEDAVDLQDEDLDDGISEASGQGEDDVSKADEIDDVDEETGSVDELDPSAVDEKLWDKPGGKDKERTETSKAKGNTQKEDEMASEPDQTGDEYRGENDDVDSIDDEAIPEERLGREEREEFDPHTDQGQNLDLPEHMDIDGGEQQLSDSGLENSDLGDFSDIEPQNEGEPEEDTSIASGSNEGSDEDQHEQKDVQGEETSSNDDKGGQEDFGPSQDTECEDDGEADSSEFLRSHDSGVDVDEKNVAPSEAQGTGGDLPDLAEIDQTNESKAQGEKGIRGEASSDQKSQAAAQTGQFGRPEEASTADQENEAVPLQSKENKLIRRLGDALEKWHRQQRQIQEAQSDEERTPKPFDLDERTADFEHLQEEHAEADTQALGTATEDQARALDIRAFDSEMQDQPTDITPELADSEEDQADEQNADSDVEMIDVGQLQEQPKPGAFIGNSDPRSRQDRESDNTNLSDEQDVQDLDTNFSTTHLESLEEESSFRSYEEARALWTHSESVTHSLSLALTEDLRLILTPTQATKMRGDFRTGKRLNIKRIIPYIASNYKRDKIWMRRSAPSKRRYQVMLAVDDSKSMGDAKSGNKNNNSSSSKLAFETLALVSRSLSMLEVGEICVVSFGSHVRVAHAFDAPFTTPDSGVQVFRNFTFAQTRTDVRKLVAASIELFREARAKAHHSAAELWQLELIISDGICEDHGEIRRLLRQAMEERIMVVFVIVDSVGEESIVDMNEAVFEPDASGEPRVRMKRYLDGFPFPYYLVVGDVRELPDVLAQALRQWFSEVVDRG